MRNYKLTIEYDGTHFYGWQIQNSRQRTVQGEIEKVIKILFKKELRLIGSSRTDRGAHALGQVAHFKITSAIDPKAMLRAFNANLPEDIVIHKIEEVKEKFHAQFSAKRKLYRFTLLHHDVRGVLARHSCFFYPYKLNLSAVRRAANIFIGKKDFKSFVSSDPALRNSVQERNTVRTVYQFDIRKEGCYIYFDIVANGFLYKMVRNIVGTLLEVGSGQRPEKSLQQILKAKDRRLAGKPVPAKGLCLLQVIY